VTHGVGLLALPLILPAMLADLGWTNWHAGLLASACALGYAVGLLLTFASRRVVSAVRLYQIGLVLAAAALLVTGSTRDFVQLAALRFASGLAAAPILICGATLASSIYVYEPQRSRRVLAMFEGGTCAGIVLAGVVLPFMLQAFGPKGWPEVWLTLGLVALVSMPFSFWASQRVAVWRPVAQRPQALIARYVPALTAYALFGAGTFALFNFLVVRAQERGANIYAIVALWSTLGLAGLLAPVFWQPLMVTLSASRRIAATIGLTAAGAALLLPDGPPAMLVVAAALLGFGAFMVPASMTHLVRSTVPQDDWTPAIAMFALAAGAGQAIGPALAGWIAHETGSLLTPYAVITGLLLTGALLALWQTATVALPRPGTGIQVVRRP
jgi:MFS family permease